MGELDFRNKFTFFFPKSRRGQGAAAQRTFYILCSYQTHRAKSLDKSLEVTIVHRTEQILSIAQSEVSNLVGS